MERTTFAVTIPAEQGIAPARSPAHSQTVSFLIAMNNWNIPEWLENEVRARDKKCVYCGVEMVHNVRRGSSRKAAATWEHIINDARIITRENIALCCSSCNSSKGEKPLAVWLQSAYCASRGVNEATVAQIIKDALSPARNSAEQITPTDLREPGTLPFMDDLFSAPTGS